MEIKKLTVQYESREVFRDFSISFADGKITCILGRSGSGKTTLLNAVSKEQNRAISYVFQEDRLLPNCTVKKNLEFVLSSVMGKEQCEEAIDSVLSTVSLSDRKEAFPRELSGGEKQRVSMARAFAFPSDVLLMDEPFRALDLALKMRLMEAFSRLYEGAPRTVLFVTHDVDEALLLADRIIVIDKSPASVVLDVSVDVPRKTRSLTNGSLDALRAKVVETMLRINE